MKRTGTLKDLAAEFDRATQEARELVEGVSADQLIAQPEPGSWSIAECLEHLTMSTDAMLPLLQAGTDHLPDEDKSLRYGLDIRGATMVWLMEPPARMRMRSPEHFRPRDLEMLARASERFSASQDRLRRYIESARGRALTRVKITSPFNSSVRYSLYAALRILAAHQRRHLWQAGRVRTLISHA